MLILKGSANKATVLNQLAEGHTHLTFDFKGNCHGAAFDTKCYSLVSESLDRFIGDVVFWSRREFYDIPATDESQFDYIFVYTNELEGDVMAHKDKFAGIEKYCDILIVTCK